jgi:hypothetical protein
MSLVRVAKTKMIGRKIMCFNIAFPYMNLKRKPVSKVMVLCDVTLCRLVCAVCVFLEECAAPTPLP